MSCGVTVPSPFAQAWRERHVEKAYWRARAADVAAVITSTRVQRMLWAWQQLAHEMAVTREEHHRRQLALREAYVVAEKRWGLLALLNMRWAGFFVVVLHIVWLRLPAWLVHADFGVRAENLRFRFLMDRSGMFWLERWTISEAII